MKRERARIIYHHDSVIKVQDRRNTFLEIARTEIGQEIGRQSCTFSVPRVLTHEWEKGTITFERIFSMNTLRYMLATVLSPEELIKKAAIALAAIHNFPVNSRKTTPIGLNASTPKKTPKVFIHGDFSITNIFFRKEENDLCIIDWGPPIWLHINPGGGSIYQDLGIFIISLFMRRPLEQDKIHNPSLLATIFLDYYRRHTNEEFNLAFLKSYYPSLVDRLLSFQRNIKQKLAMLARYRTLHMSRQFMDNVQLN